MTFYFFKDHGMLWLVNDVCRGFAVESRDDAKSRVDNIARCSKVECTLIDGKPS